jgi:polyisoprenoid-binding protein YceI
MKKIIAPLLILTVSLLSFTLVKSTVTRSAITFKIKNMGIGVEGSFGGLQADVQFDPADLPKSNINASIDAGSINSDNSSRDDHLKGEDFFDVAHYPNITLKSVAFKHKSGNNYTGQFNLTIKGKTKLIDVPFTFTEKGNTRAFKGSFKLNRLDFGVGDSSLILADEATVNIDTEVRE